MIEANQVDQPKDRDVGINVVVHTPGPWSSSEQRGDPGHCFVAQVWDSNGNALASVRPTKDERQSTVDARLIAAAPEMLEALIRQRDNIERWLETGEPADAEESRAIYEQIQDAIKVASSVV